MLYTYLFKPHFINKNALLSKACLFKYFNLKVLAMLDWDKQQRNAVLITENITMFFVY